MPAIRSTKTKATTKDTKSKGIKTEPPSTPGAVSSSASSTGSSTATAANAKKSTRWPDDQDEHFMMKMQDLLMKNLWPEVKDHPGIRARQSSGVKAHIKAMFNKLSSATPARSTKKATSWNDDEEACFKQKAFDYLMKHGWAAVKDHPGIRARQSSGVKAHIKALFNKL